MIEIRDFCQPTIDLSSVKKFQPSTLTYTIFEQGVTALFDPAWTTDPPICNLHYTYTPLPLPANPNLIVVDENK